MDVPGGLSPEETLDRRTLVVTGIRESSEAARNRAVSVFFDYGAEVRWFGTECMLAFPTERQTLNALEAASKGVGTLCNVGKISSMGEDLQKSYFRLAAEMHEELKPERDSRVANRLIGAALGIKLPVKTAVAAAPEKPKAPVVDAWDD